MLFIPSNNFVNREVNQPICSFVNPVVLNIRTIELIVNTLYNKNCYETFNASGG